MILKEIVRTCSNADVAGAALRSIGGKFAENFASHASQSNFSPGTLAALIVKQFAENASIEEMADVHAATHGTDQPLLAGLRHILAAAVGVR
jgi:hypothetical protein